MRDVVTYNIWWRWTTISFRLYGVSNSDSSWVTQPEGRDRTIKSRVWSGPLSKPEAGEPSQAWRKSCMGRPFLWRVTLETPPFVGCRDILRAVTSFLIPSNLYLSWLRIVEVTHTKREQGKKGVFVFYPLQPKGSHYQHEWAMLRVTTNRGVSKRSSQPKGSENNMSKTENKDKPSTAP